MLSFGFLLVLLLVVSKFKHVKGFGFSAETWDQKQVEAAALVDRLQFLSRSVSEQVALIAAKLGLWDSALTNPELDDLSSQIDQLLEAADVPRAHRNQILAPVHHRVELNYYFAASHLVKKAFTEAQTALSKKLEAPKPEERPELQERARLAGEEGFRSLGALPHAAFIERRSLQPLIDCVRGSRSLDDAESLLAELEAMGADLAFFVANRSLRRRIDLTYVFRG